MKNVRVLSAIESKTVRGGLYYCTISRPCPDGWCCDLNDCLDGDCVCKKGGAYGGCPTP